MRISDWSSDVCSSDLLANADIDARWCLVHATHLTDGEGDALAASGAVAGLCPVTEANLGDGIFPAARYLAAGGTFATGTDSNLRIHADRTSVVSRKSASVRVDPGDRRILKKKKIKND